MPSRHASTLYYFASYLTIFLFVLEPRQVSLSGESSSSCRISKLVLMALLHALTFGMTAVRYTEELHSIPQLVAGAVLGSICGALWCLLATFYINPAAQELLQHWPF